MSSTPPSKKPTETPGIPAVIMPWSVTMPQHAAFGQPKERVREGAQSQSNDQAQDLPIWSGLMKEFLLSNHKEKDVDIMLNVFKDRKACDTIFVCHLMTHVWGEFKKDDIARVIQARGVCKFDHDDDCRSSQVSTIVTFMESGGSDIFGGGAKEVLDALSQWQKWLKVKEKFSPRSGERDENDKDKNAAWKIWRDAMAELETLKELDKKSIEADDSKPTSRHGSLPT